ncbi:pantoate--beta-alanine ligase [Bacillaceae bacterium Marseille-Q3522]|nr:pantoate--beta-alanine ligase [Bacillaceae bacterium Marseille-Q3522]
MKIITNRMEMQETIKNEKKANQSIGFVPTMGFLHEGHQALMRQARTENDIVVLSIFVNPLQFGPSEDFSRYPRDFDHDKEVAEAAGVDFVFYPTVAEIYPHEPSVTVKVEKRTNVLCGKSRPRHFNGVATVLTKLFHIVQPDRAYFGKKDAQQVAVVMGLIEDFHFPVELRTVDIVREADGLAKSSRNVYLTEEERKQAPALYQSLLAAKALFEKGEKSKAVLLSAIENELKEKTNGEIDYIDILTFPGLEDISILQGTCIIALAVKFSKARLIDNIIIQR